MSRVYYVSGKHKIGVSPPMEDWIFVLIQKGSNAKKEIHSCTEPEKIGPSLPRKIM
jgi:hypothetical protein